MRAWCVVCTLVTVTLATPGLAQLSPTETWAVEAANRYRVEPDVPYPTADGGEMRLDVYYRTNVPAPQPTLIYMHGGFWVAGAKEGAIMSLLPWLEMGWNVVNVEYRLGDAAPAPAAVQDSFCALRFVASQAERYGIDTERLVVTGESAGGHLALTLGMIPDRIGLANRCPGTETPRVAAVINWFGVTDVADVIDGPNRQNAAARWFGDMPLAEALGIAERVSPLAYVRADLPPILSIHGDSDNVVPYQEGVDLHAALDQVGAPNRLLTIPGAGHGRFNDEQRVRAYVTIRRFLAEHGLMN